MLYMALHSREARECASRVCYTETRIHEAKALLEHVREEWDDLYSEKIASKSKTRNYKDCRAKAHAHYRHVANIFQCILRGDRELLGQLRTNVRKGFGYEDWVKGVDIFYKIALDAPDVLPTFKRFPANVKLLQEGREMLEEVRRARAEMEKIRQQVEEKTAAKNQTLTKLTDWVARYKNLMCIAADQSIPIQGVSPTKRKKEIKKKLKRMGII
ncbi:MAG: hypothetical protein GY765_11755 [bacterium]|nr:hypothetical protein [bacterium]